MDVSPYFICAAFFGLGGYFGARVWSFFRRRREIRAGVRANLGLALDRLPAVDLLDGDTTAGTTSGDNPQTGRRAIHRDYFGDSAGAHAAGRDPRIADAASVA